MTSINWKRVQAKRAAEILRGVPFSDAGLEFLHEDHTPAAFLAVLRERRRYREALQFLIYALPKREAVWWTCLCVEAACGAKLTANERAALDSAVQWVLDPTEPNRLAVYPPGNAPGVPKTAAGIVAMAAYYTGNNRLAPDSPVSVPPSPLLFARTVQKVVLLAASGGEGCEFIKNYRQFIVLGQGVAEGKYLWTPVGG